MVLLLEWPGCMASHLAARPASSFPASQSLPSALQPPLIHSVNAMTENERLVMEIDSPEFGPVVQVRLCMGVRLCA